ncbi:glucose-1-phosphate cytidylyltransferase [Lacrimispora defluvii]|uniref:Glucose-1-phosphate cytidylyltransferase n=1 Tax=Lacrimispora defluvii TaxID=2719233 RepID=A0ABX1VWK4_9FIRM|nr:glucose-1-phosphate cytidylyltransferase [Lacrimispora defluvii]NNJ32823.1 glucose-1-phosphate cytidylyltransferase [Lacrimispora defluvii]
MKVVLLAGGMGTRISEESAYRPKPMVEISGMPILWHIMKEYSYYGYNEFIICAGYKQEYIKEWFDNFFLHSSDIEYDFTEGKKEVVVRETHVEPWKVTIVDTGLNTMTGGRVKRVQKYIGNEPFMLTYGDGVCDVNIAELVKFHKQHGKIATLTSVIQKQEKGVLDISEVGEVRSFREKRSGDGIPINAGYMVLQPEVFDYLKDDSTIFERVALEQLSDEKQLMSYVHTGFWQCMDSVREKKILEQIWDKGNAAWAVWNEGNKNG